MIKKILVSQPQPSSEKSPYFNIAQKYGVELVFRPFIKVEGISAKEFRKQKINIPDYTAVVFTSRTAVDNFFRIAREQRITIPEDMKYFGISETVSLYIQKYVVYRKRKVFFGTSGKLPELVSVMMKHKTEKYLIPMSDVHDDHIKTTLDSKGLKYKEAVMYRTVSNDFKPEEKFDYDMLIFFTSAGVQSLKKNFPDFEQGDIKIVCYGNSAQKAVDELGLRLDVAAPTPETPSITAALDKYLAENK
jgi:uroporphyrinogen-III synthase